MKILAIIILLALLAGCAAPVALQSRFDPAEVAWFAARGTNTIEGTAIARSCCQGRPSGRRHTRSKPRPGAARGRSKQGIFYSWSSYSPTERGRNPRG